MEIDIDLINKEVNNWRRDQEWFLKSAVSRLSKYGKGELLAGIKSSTKKDTAGIIEKVTFSFPRHGVFFHKGVGRGYHVQGGNVVKISKEKTNQSEKKEALKTFKIQAKFGSIGNGTTSESGRMRKPVEWFAPNMDAAIPELIDIICNRMADLTAQTMVDSTSKVNMI